MGARTDRNREKKSSWKKKLGITLLVILIIVIIIAGIGAGFVMSKLNKVNYVEIKEEEIEVNEGVSESLSQYRNIVLFGIDARADTYSAGNRSDCIIIASINEKTKEIRLVSVYRDSYLNITGRGLDKVTHAYSYGGPSLAMSTLNTNLDLDITEFVAVNFDAVIDIVDAVGGVTIDVESAELQYLNQYMDDMANEIGRRSSHVSSAGRQTLDGVQALAYSRIRYTSGGDYKRTERMRDVLMAVFDKAKKMSIGQLNNLADKILPSVYTNISSGEIISLIPQVASYSVSDSIGWPYEVKGITLDRWYGVPVTLEDNVIQLHEALFEDEEYEPSDAVVSTSNSIIKKTGYR